MPALRTLVRAVVGFALLGVAAGCQRKAPGPEECARFAEVVVGVHRYITPVMAEQIEAQTRECLTQPYDRELLDCVVLTRQARPCLVAFRARKAKTNVGIDQEPPQ
ncbi:MAG TPA: hypothetical protein VER96_34970 [Polyangiaceae bacterium]|nr:hypothetical protein [Polyangiaceae bacterium]